MNEKPSVLFPALREDFLTVLKSKFQDDIAGDRWEEFYQAVVKELSHRVAV